MKGDNNVGWTYFVPSTNYLTSFDCIYRSDILDCTWENDHGMSGTGILSRKK